MQVEILVPIALFAGIFGILYVFYTTRNKERLAMIEKGADPSIFANRKKRIGIKLGLLAIGAAIGILIGQVLTSSTNMEEEVATISMILLFAGMGLVAEHFLAKREADKEA
jgi:uncharacterized membrane protein YfcA